MFLQVINPVTFRSQMRCFKRGVWLKYHRSGCGMPGHHWLCWVSKDAVRLGAGRLEAPFPGVFRPPEPGHSEAGTCALDTFR